MCGIAGIALGHRDTRDALLGAVVPMTRVLAHRGPDGEGYWISPEQGVAFGHRRLAVIDLSEHGRQPMVSPGGRFVIAFNGEIYNYRHLRRRLETEDPSRQWRGHSDTEVLLAAFEAWGIRATLQAANGMFALALWDTRNRRLVLARDRFGEKPLYYSLDRGALAFGSEVKSLTSRPGFGGVVDEDARRLYRRYGFVPAPFAIYSGIRKLAPGSWVEVLVDSAGLHVGNEQSFWDPVETAVSARRAVIEDRGEAVTRVESALAEAVKLRLESDVPLGAFLSGGIDSTLIVALMQQANGGRTKTFSIGSTDERHNEADFARAVARHLGTEHVEHYATPEDTIACVRESIELCDEPFADSSQVPVLMVSRVARQHVTVALTGDGGDELFGGYNRYFLGQAAQRWSNSLPASVRALAAGTLTAVSARNWDRAFSLAGQVVGRRRTLGLTGDRVHKFASAFGAASPAEMYWRMVSNPPSRGDPALGSDPIAAFLRRPDVWGPGWSAADSMMLTDTSWILPDDFLVKVDRASMSLSLETRSPFLDPVVFDTAWRLRDEHRMSTRVGKVILREIVDRHVPRTLMDRPKQGFAIPVARWLRKELRDWVEPWMQRDRIEADLGESAEPILARWRAHALGRADHHVDVWNVVMLLMWCEQERRRRAAPPRIPVSSPDFVAMVAEA